MKVLDLQCAHQHAFEGWFASEEDFQSQWGRGLVECPVCADKAIQKLPSAPRLNLSAALPSSDSPVPRPADQPVPAVVAGRAGPSTAAQGAFLKALRQVLAHTEDVGERFAEEARRMHYGDTESRNIRGQTSAREAVELMEEGIDVMPLHLPPALKETLQ